MWLYSKPPQLSSIAWSYLTQSKEEKAMFIIDKYLEWLSSFKMGTTPLDGLMEFYQFAPWHPLIMLILFWVFWPGGMFIVARLVERRSVYLGKGQSRMFFPGDFMLGLAVINFIGMYAKIDSDLGPTIKAVYSWKYWALTAAIHLVLAILIRIPDCKRYPKYSANSPTKLAHDFSGYFVCFWLIASLGLPRIAWAIKYSFASAKGHWIIFAFAAAFFISMTVYDLTHPASDADLLLMHPEFRRKTRED
jgi:hypothetical protein